MEIGNFRPAQEDKNLSPIVAVQSSLITYCPSLVTVVYARDGEKGGIQKRERERKRETDDLRRGIKGRK